MTKVRTSRGPGRPARSENRDTRAQILRSSQQLFAQTGFEATSLRQIAVDADVDLATVKYHFTDKASLYDEAYRIGHTRMVDAFSPLMVAVAAAESEADLRDALIRLGKGITTFVSEQRPFVRLSLFRILERADDEASVTHQLQAELVELIVLGFERAKSAAFARDVDIRAFFTFMLAGVPMWLVSTEVRSAMVGEPAVDGPSWGKRVEDFVTDLLLRTLMVRSD